MRRECLFGFGRDNCLVAVALFLWASGEGMFLYIQPLYIAQLGAGPVQIGSVLALDGAVRAVSFIPGGMLADRIGPRRVIQMGWLVGLAAVALMSMARDWWGFIPGVALYALSAFCIPAVSSYVAAARGKLPLERELTLVFAGYAAGNIASPAVGGWLAGMWGMRATYMAACGFLLMSCLVVMRLTDCAAGEPFALEAGRAGLPRSLFGGWWMPLRPLAAYSGLIFLIFLSMYLG